MISGVNGIHISDGNAQQWLRLLVLLYADDTLIISDNPTDFQHAFDCFSNYCHDWKLTVNSAKSNVIVFGSRVRHRYEFKINW